MGSEPLGDAGRAKHMAAGFDFGSVITVISDCGGRKVPEEKKKG